MLTLPFPVPPKCPGTTVSIVNP